MGLGDFYKQVEKIIINDIILHLIKSKGTDNVTILNLYTSQYKHVDELTNICNMGIGNDPLEFVKNVSSYRQSLKSRKFDIVNCRFSARSFMSSIRELLGFTGFIADALKPGGILMGFLLDINKLNGIFSETTSLSNGPYRIEYTSSTPNYVDVAYNSKRYSHDKYPTDNRPRTFNEYISYQVVVNDDIVNIVNFTTLKSLCGQFGLIHVDNIILESLYNNSLSHISLADYEKQFGFLNYAFLFQKV
jgi:hypothetical protein